MPVEPIRIFVVDNHPIVRAGLAAMIRGGIGLLWVGEAGDGAQGVELACLARADVVLMDLQLPHVDGIDATAMLLHRRPQSRVVLITSRVEPAEIRRALAAGASGYVSKTASAHELVDAIRGVWAGRRMLSAEAERALGKPATATAAAAAPAPAPGADLTAREREVLQALAQGGSNQAIAAALAISVPTVKFHITHILAKLHVASRTEAVLLALQHKLVSPG